MIDDNLGPHARHWGYVVRRPYMIYGVRQHLVSHKEASVPTRRPSVSDRIAGHTPATDSPPGEGGRRAFSAPAALITSAMIATELIDPSPDNPRSSLGDLDELTASIRELGVISPVAVTPNGSRYTLVYGHRRLAAAIAAGLASVPAILSTEIDAHRIQAQRIAENVQRADLSPLEEARAYHELLSILGAGGQRAVAKLVSKSQGHISKRLALLRLPAPVQTQVDSGRITLEDASELTKLADDPERVTEVLEAAGRTYGGVAGAVQRELRAADERRRREAEADALRAAGVTVIDEPRTYSRQHGPYPLHSIAIAAEDHAGLECHAAVIPTYGGSCLLVCLDPQAHLGNEDAAADQRRVAAETARAERLSAARARRALAASLVRSTNPDAGASVLVDQLVAAKGWLPSHYDELAAELLGLEADTYHGGDARGAISAYAAKGTRNAGRAAYALGLALGEASTAYAYTTSARIAYFDHLVANGYTLGEAEIALLGDDGDDDEEDEDLDEEGEGSK